MLCDFFESFMKLSVFPLMPEGMQIAVRTVGEAVAKCPRYVLNRQATMMIQNLSMMSAKNFLSALGLCRLPFSPMWVELVFQDRADWLKEATAMGVKTSQNAESSEPKRLGFFLYNLNDNPKIIVIQPAWSHIEPAIDVARKAIVIDLEDAAYPEEKRKEDFINAPQIAKSEKRSFEETIAFLELVNRIQYIVPSYHYVTWAEARQQGPKAVEHLETLANYDLASEWKFVIALLIMLNSRNVIKYGEDVNFEKLNKIREKKGSPKLLSHKEIKLSLSAGLQSRMAKGYASMKREKSDEPSWISGHWKIRKSGIYWWNFHQRNARNTKGKDAEFKTYDVTE